MQEKDDLNLAEKIAGEIVFSPSPGKTIRKWRDIFDVKQSELAKHLGTSASVISDYEGGRRKSPGIATIKKMVAALLEIDEGKGGRIIRKYKVLGKSEAIIDIKEFSRSVSLMEFVDKLDGELINKKHISLSRRDIHGYTFMDSVKAILEFGSHDYMRVYGWSTERALLFTGVYYGRSPMIAVRVHPLKPAAVVYHKPERVDDLAVKLADIEAIPLIVTRLKEEKIIDYLSEI